MRAGRIRYARRDRPYAPFVPGTPAFPVITGIPPAAAITAATLANGHKTAGRTPVRRRLKPLVQFSFQRANQLLTYQMHF